MKTSTERSKFGKACELCSRLHNSKIALVAGGAALTLVAVGIEVGRVRNNMLTIMKHVPQTKWHEENPRQQFHTSEVPPKVFTLPNGQKCFVAESQTTFCTDEKGVYQAQRPAVSAPQLPNAGRAFPKG
jgi:hypothetical protein